MRNPNTPLTVLGLTQHVVELFYGHNVWVDVTEEEVDGVLTFAVGEIVRPVSNLSAKKDFL